MQQPVKERIAKLRQEIAQNQRSEPPILARWQEDAWFVVGPRTTAAEIKGKLVTTAIKTFKRDLAHCRVRGNFGSSAVGVHQLQGISLA